MKTTLIIDDVLIRRLKALAAQRGESLSSLVQAFLRSALAEATRNRRKSIEPEELPSHKMGEPRVDIADREALEQVMERADRVRR